MPFDASRHSGLVVTPSRYYLRNDLFCSQLRSIVRFPLVSTLEIKGALVLGAQASPPAGYPKDTFGQAEQAGRLRSQHQRSRASQAHY